VTHGGDIIKRSLGDKAASVTAIYSPETRKIYLNDKHEFYTNPKSYQQKYFESGFHSSADPNHIINHEIAHAKHHRIVGGDADTFTYGKWTKLSPSQKAVARQVGEYASTDRLEFVAETYSGLKAGKKYSESVMRQYREFEGPRV
jgi:hypothetical protein